ncbi:GTPase domain-containing protein [Leadbettera azotonutricia]|uniref:Double-GTPase 2 domain-containing protein n=1 Tax=Leadbettera azotonutricia (strain ATCC BAA-888 / DSM 13862 / ZAS-9) TaxID=545695 RepID=F5Y7K4_LEAAZ|nr:GTPase domain-containing protein [Leadbettera azotonutricia]AEF82317.1 hypothetical protein TREAZ_1074 [Leadbettera azotonutricia ZAS-9]
MGYIILAVIVIYLLYLLIRYVIIPLVSIIASASAGIGVVSAFLVSLINYVRSCVANRNPYTTYVDASSKKPFKEARRSYFFGPGYHQISNIIKGAWSNNVETWGKVRSWVNGLGSPWYIKMFPWLFFIVFSVVIWVFGSLWTAVFSAVHFVFIFAFMCIVYALFTLLWISDRLVLLVNSISARCPDCKERSTIPAFLCPSCGTKHTNLVPGPYGIFSTTCSCGCKLPSTFLNGRSKLEAICPDCGHELASSSASQFGIQLVGGVSAGKTTFLTSFLHLYLQNLRKNNGIEIKAYPQDSFNELEKWFATGKSESTNDMNANMYSIVYKRRNSDLSHQLSIYDIAGEVFENQSAVGQHQYHYCEGIIFMVDPFSVAGVRTQYESVHGGTLPMNFSTSNIGDVITGYIEEFSKKYTKTGKMSDIPVSVVITKADVDIIKKQIGLPKILENFKNNAERYHNNKDEARDSICREYLNSIGMSGVLNNLKAQFTNVHYFPISAMGHEKSENDSYDPWGVLEPVMWIINQYDAKLTEILK